MSDVGISAPDALQDRKVALLGDAAKTIQVSTRKLRALMAQYEVPEIELGPRRRGILVAHLDEILAACARPAQRTP